MPLRVPDRPTKATASVLTRHLCILFRSNLLPYSMSNRACSSTSDSSGFFLIIALPPGLVQQHHFGEGVALRRFREVLACDGPVIGGEVRLRAPLVVRADLGQDAQPGDDLPAAEQ